MPPIDFVIDVAVIRPQEEQLPDGYVMLERTVRGSSANLNKAGILSRAPKIHLCYKRGDGPHNHPYVVCDIHVINQGHEPVPHGYMPVTKTVGGRSADLNFGSGGQHLTLCILTRARHQARSALYEIACFRPKKKEQMPDGFTKTVSKNLNGGSSGEPVYLAVKMVDIITTNTPPPQPPAAGLTSDPHLSTSSLSEQLNPAFTPSATQAGQFFASSPSVPPELRTALLPPRGAAPGPLKRSMSTSAGGVGTLLTGVPLRRPRDASSMAGLRQALPDVAAGRGDVHLRFQYSFETEHKVLQMSRA